jgi:hypothetical protein
MGDISWSQGLSWALAAFFVLGFVINTFAVKLVGPEYRRWGYPDWFHFVSGGLDLVVMLLLPAAATRPFGVLLGGAIMARRHRHRHPPSRISPGGAAVHRACPAGSCRLDDRGALAGRIDLIRPASGGSGPAAVPSAGDQAQPRRRMESAHQQVHRHHSAQQRRVLRGRAAHVRHAVAENTGQQRHECEARCGRKA